MMLLMMDTPNNMKNRVNDRCLQPRGARMNSGKSLLSGLVVGLIITRLATPARAQDDHPTPSGPPTRAEFSKLQADVREQRELIIQMLQTEQQRYDMLLRLLSGQGGGAPMVTLPAAPEVPSATAAESSPRRAVASRQEVERRSAVVEGKVNVSGGELGDIYVYVENAKGPPAKGKTIEIRQEGKQFNPRVAVVPAGTNVIFPNYDSIYHNVFSTSARNSFDLGSYRAGDKPRAVTLTAPGVVDIFCNMHQKMSASVLVVPNGLYTKVRADGTFRLEGVPVGQRKIVAWSPQAKTVQQRIEVTPSGAQVTFALVRQEAAAHTNKVGQAYGSYRE
jgi:plastocyanin